MIKIIKGNNKSSNFICNRTNNQKKKRNKEKKSLQNLCNQMINKQNN